MLGDYEKGAWLIFFGSIEETFHSFVQQREDDLFTLNIYYAFAKKTENPRGGNFWWRRRGRWHGSAPSQHMLWWRSMKVVAFHCTSHNVLLLSLKLFVFPSLNQKENFHTFFCVKHIKCLCNGKKSCRQSMKRQILNIITLPCRDTLLIPFNRDFNRLHRMNGGDVKFCPMLMKADFMF